MPLYVVSLWLLIFKEISIFWGYSAFEWNKSDFFLSEIWPYKKMKCTQNCWETKTCLCCWNVWICCVSSTGCTTERQSWIVLWCTNYGLNVGCRLFKLTANTTKFKTEKKKNFRIQLKRQHGILRVNSEKQI